QHAVGGEAADGRATDHSRPVRRGLLLSRNGAGRRPVGGGGGCRGVPRPDLLHRRPVGDAGRARRRGRDRRGAPGRRPLQAPVPEIRAPRPGALPSLPPLRGGLLQPELPGSVVPADQARGPLRGRALDPRRELASVARASAPDLVLLLAGRAAAGAAHRAAGPPDARGDGLDQARRIFEERCRARTRCRIAGEREAPVNTSCDPLVALGAETRSGRTLFAKNSDRPATECQPLQAVPARRHAPDATVRCTYLEIPEAPETLAVLGSRPWWIWGFEHGVNEAGVAIGNEALHTRETPAETGLLGMDLLRLGLEPGGRGDDAKRVITDLLTRYGQGGSAQYAGRRFYHNSFIIADPGTAWVLETSGRHWVARRVHGRAAISNLATIGDDWDEASPGIEAYATAPGWWDPTPGGRFHFRAAFETPEPRYRAEARYDASCRFLARTDPPDVPAMLRHLRDHYEGGTIHHPGRKDGDPQGWSVCMHPEPATGATAAAMVAELGPERPVIAWCAQTTPCTSVFLPLPGGAVLPEVRTRGVSAAG